MFNEKYKEPSSVMTHKKKKYVSLGDYKVIEQQARCNWKMAMNFHKQAKDGNKAFKVLLNSIENSNHIKTLLTELDDLRGYKEDKVEEERISKVVEKKLDGKEPGLY